MKIAWLMVALCVLAAPVMAQAADANATAAVDNASVNATQAVAINESQVGAVPGDWNYGFKRLFENVDKFLTFDNVGKARKDAAYANSRAEEAYVLSGRAAKLNAEGKASEAQAALAAVDALIAEHASELNDSQTELEAAVDSGTANATQVAEVQNATRNSITVLQRVYEKVPEQAKDSILRALNNSINNQARHEQNIADKAKHGKGQDNGTSGNLTDSGNSNETENLNETGSNGTSDNETEIEDANETGTGNGNTHGNANQENSTSGPGNSGSHGNGRGED